MRNSRPRIRLLDLAKMRVEEFAGQINRLTVRMREIVFEAIRETFANLARDSADRLLALVAKAQTNLPYYHSPSADYDPWNEDAGDHCADAFESSWSNRQHYADSTSSTIAPGSHVKRFSWAALTALVLAWTSRLTSGTPVKSVLKLLGLHGWVRALIRLLPTR